MKVAGVVFPTPRPQKGGRIYTTYYEGRKRRFVTAPDLDALKLKLAKISTHLRNGTLDAAKLGAADLRELVTARTALAPTGMSIDAAVRVFVEAANILGDSGKLIEAAKLFREMQPSLQIQATLSDCIAAFLAAKRAAHLSEAYTDKLEKDFDTLAKAFPGARISALRAAELDAWLDRLAVGPRRRRNLRDSLITLWRYARDHGLLASGLRTEAEKIARPRVIPGDVAIYTPHELDVLFSHARGDLVAAIALGAFAGLRPAEISRLQWTAIDLERGVIKLRASETKTRTARPVTILPTLSKWLALFPDRGGPVLTTSRLDLQMQRLCKRCGVKHRPNGLRHSFGTYYTAHTRNLAEVALQMGNSPTIIRRHYLDAVSEDAARRWFSLVPADMTKVLPLEFR